jgi:hypothetical protein
VTFAPVHAAPRRAPPQRPDDAPEDAPFSDIAASCSVDSLSSLGAAPERDYDPLGSFFEQGPAWFGRSQSVDFANPFQ